MIPNFYKQFRNSVEKQGHDLRECYDLSSMKKSGDWLLANLDRKRTKTAIDIEITKAHAKQYRREVSQTLYSDCPVTSDPTNTCIEMFVRDGYNLEDAIFVAACLRVMHATEVDVIVEELVRQEKRE